MEQGASDSTPTFVGPFRSIFAKSGCVDEKTAKSFCSKKNSKEKEYFAREMTYKGTAVTVCEDTQKPLTSGGAESNGDWHRGFCAGCNEPKNSYKACNELLADGTWDEINNPHIR